MLAGLGATVALLFAGCGQLDHTDGGVRIKNLTSWELDYLEAEGEILLDVEHHVEDQELEEGESRVYFGVPPGRSQEIEAGFFTEWRERECSVFAEASGRCVQYTTYNCGGHNSGVSEDEIDVSAGFSTRLTIRHAEKRVGCPNKHESDVAPGSISMDASSGWNTAY